MIPPEGGTAQTTVTDVFGQVVERLSYTDAERTESVKATYAYDKHGNLARMTDAAGNTWSWTFDARGRETRADDPDKGVTTTVYDELDRPVRTTDARGVTLTSTYDALGRTIELKQGDELRAKWTYDTLLKGQPTADTRYIDGQAYTTEVGGYNDRYQPTSSTVRLPASEGALIGSYSWSYGYNQYTGTQEWIRHPAMGGLPAERVTTVYGEGDLPIRTVADRQTLVSDVVYDPLARPIRTEYGVLGRKVYETHDWDEHTGALNRRTLDGEVALRIEDTRYTYDDMGNVTRISSTSGQDQQASIDNQCFVVDALRRMTQAWTTKSATDDCSTGPSATTVGGPDAYWHSYSYDVTGNRTEEVRHAVSSGGEDTTRAYTYGRPGQDAPHALRSVTTTGGTADGQRETFAYDEAGNTTARTGGARGQQLTWDAEGRLATVTENGKTTSYVYDAGGNRLIARNADGSATAYLPGGNELKAADGKVTGTRYYTHGGQTVAARTGSGGINLLFPDQQGTALIAVAWGAGQAVTRRKQLPFGGPRAASGTWPGDRGFLSGTTDPTGTTHLGAREYDPDLGRFLSVDPLLLPEDPTQHNAYAYGNNNPATFADPTGEAYEECVSGQYNCTYGRSTGDVNKVTFGKNYKKETKARGGTISPNYTIQQNTNYRHVYTKGKGVTRPTTTQRSRSAQIEKQKRHDQERKAAEDRRKRNEALRKQAEKQDNKNKQDEGFWSKLGRETKKTFGTWDGWKNRVLPGAAFAACLVVSAGLCTVAGVAVVGATFVGDGLTTGSWNYAAAGKSLAWTLAGGAAARGIARSWRGSAFESRIRVKTVSEMENVTIYGYRKTIDWGATQANVSLNFANLGTFCGAGAASPGDAAGWC
ncbi:RHS repeat-associated core domain-containing protein [Streptomyces sp. bgisy022]|uniref:RHS repeat-associated core domain-containing protein n=1 Tax=Streptomyces sp. bgisy022 TaxID=3413769 RepID=UPI003D74A7B3